MTQGTKVNIGYAVVAAILVIAGLVWLSGGCAAGNKGVDLSRDTRYTAEATVSPKVDVDADGHVNVTNITLSSVGATGWGILPLVGVALLWRRLSVAVKALDRTVGAIEEGHNGKQDAEYVKSVIRRENEPLWGATADAAEHFIRKRIKAAKG